MEINSLLCELIDTDKGFDNQDLADKIETVSDEFAIEFAKFCVTTQAFGMYGFEGALKIFKNNLKH